MSGTLNPRSHVLEDRMAEAAVELVAQKSRESGLRARRVVVGVIGHDRVELPDPELLVVIGRPI